MGKVCFVLIAIVIAIASIAFAETAIDVSAGTVLIGDDWGAGKFRAANGLTAGITLRPDDDLGDPGKLLLRYNYNQNAFSSLTAGYNIKRWAGVDWFIGGALVLEGDNLSELRLGGGLDIAGFFKEGENHWELRLGTVALNGRRLGIMIKLGALTK
jgi:hypothetical protein